MIRALLRNGRGDPSAVLLGLGDVNIRLLREGKPIAVKAQELAPDLPDVLVCLFFATPDDIAAMVKGQTPPTIAEAMT